MNLKELIYNEEEVINQSKEVINVDIEDRERQSSQSFDEDTKEKNGFLTMNPLLLPHDYPVAVYGSLKKGFGNHRLLSDSKLMFDGYVKHPFFMADLGAFPALIPIGDTQESEDNYTHVEVYEVDLLTLKRLDRLEGYPSFYTRSLVWAHPNAKERKNEQWASWIYHFKDDISKANRNYSRVFQVNQHDHISWTKN